MEKAIKLRRGMEGALKLGQIIASSSMQYTGTWSAVVMIQVVSAGSSATVVAPGMVDICESYGGPSDYLLRTSMTASGTLNTTQANGVGVEFVAIAQ